MQGYVRCMDGIQNLVVFIELACVDLVIGVLVLAGIATRRWLRTLFLLAALALVPEALMVLSGSPRFDFIEICRPDGTGGCDGGLSFEQVKRSLAIDHWLAAVETILFPVAVLTATVCGFWWGLRDLGHGRKAAGAAAPP